MASPNEITVVLPRNAESERRPAGFQIIFPNRTHVLSWSRFISAKGDSTEISAIFYNCEVLIKGCGLDALLTELAAQRINLLRLLPRPERFQQAAEQLPVHIEDIHIREVEE